MITLKGTRKEIKHLDIDVKDKEFINALKEKVRLKGYALNEKETEIGFWRDESSERSNFEDMQWHCASKDEKLIELLKAIDIIEKFFKEENKHYNSEIIY